MCYYANYSTQDLEAQGDFVIIQRTDSFETARIKIPDHVSLYCLLDGEDQRILMHIYQKAGYKRRQLCQVGASKFLVETGEGRTPRPEEATQSILQA